MTDLLSTVDGLLIDIDGVLMRGNEVIPGALEAVNALRARGIPHRFITNTTIYCRLTLLDRLHALGFDVEVENLFTATYAASLYLRRLNAQSYYPLLLPDAQLEFSDIVVDEENPEFVVVGDMGPGFTFPRLNKAFRAVLNGAHLVALHKKRFWRTEDGLFLDAGLRGGAGIYDPGERRRGGQAQQAYYRMVLDDLGLPPEQVAMVGDDIEIDVQGAKRLGMQGWLVKTGRFRQEKTWAAAWPDRILEDVSALCDGEKQD
ncbi:MAG: HAD hydrolase-like protein [Caldilineaceae bacterium]